MINIKNVFLVSLLVFLISGIMFFVLKPLGQKEPSSKQTEQVATQPRSTVSNTKITGSDRCLITIDGQKYDVTVFRGGNVFICGTDMSEAFHQQHPDSFLQKIAKYKVQQSRIEFNNALERQEDLVVGGWNNGSDCFGYQILQFKNKRTLYLG